MAVLSWGECDLFCAQCVDGAPSGGWTELPTPKEDTTELTASAGSDKEATEEGGALVDYMPAKNTFELAWDEFVRKGEEPSFEDTDGVVDGEWSFRVEAQDKDCPAILIERATLKVETSYTSADGILRHHVAKALKPAEGSMVKTYTPSVKYPAGE